MADIDINGQRFSTGSKLDVFTQLAVARKLAPAMPLVDGLVRQSNADKDRSVLAVLMLAHISDTDCEYLVRKCLTVVTRQDATGRFVKVQAPDGSLMFDDIDLKSMLELTLGVIEENLGDFFRTALGNMDK